MSANEHKIRALELFDTLVELGGPEREPRLLALAQSDPELAQEVQRLLDADAAESGLLDRGVQGVAETVLSELYVNASASGLHAGTVIGSFTLLRPLGQGGMGEVWLAERRVAQADGDFVQQVALKLLKRGMDSDALVRRFVQERRILAELNHPHIARFVDGGISQDGRLYYAMEFVEGVSMLDYARQQKLNVRACVQLMSAVCDAVAHAQAHLVVHRDLKPSNILVDENSQPRVLDFGIAKLLDSSDPNQTGSEMRAMTPVYAAPEQILGEPISTATDVYALGVILYQLLTGTLPHQRSGTLISLADTVRRENIERPSAALRRSAQTLSGQTTQLDPVRAARELVGDLDTILLMALRREPARRYASAAAFGSDLRAWLAGMPVAAQLDTRGYRVRTFVRRNRGIVGGASAVFLALIAGLSLAIWQWDNARNQAVRAEREVLRVARAQDFLVSIFSSADPGQARGERLTAKEILDAGSSRLAAEFNEDPMQQAELALKLANIYLSLDAPAQVEKLTRMARSAYARLPSANNALLGEIEIMHGKLDLKREQFSQAYIRLQAGIALLREVPNRQLLVADAMLDLGHCSWQLGDTHAATRQQSEGLTLFERQAGIKSPQYARAQVQHGILFENMEQFAPARTAYEAGVGALSNIYGEVHPDTANARYMLAGILDRLGERKLADQAFALSIPTLRKLYDNRGTTLANALFSYGIFLQSGERYADAEAVYREALTMLGQDNISYAHVHRYLGQTLLLREKFPDAIAAFAVAISTFERILGANAAELWRTKSDLGAALAQTGRTQEALAMQTEAIARLSEILAQDAHQLMRPLRGLAQTQIKMANNTGAFLTLERALKIATAKVGATHLTTCQIYQSIASLSAQEKSAANARFSGPLAACLQSIAVADPQHPLLAEIRALLARLEN